jgi:putative nucleotidyltransferase with HDIG domain
VKAPGGTHEAEFRLRHEDGSWRWMQGFLTNLLDEPAVRSIVINYRDITARKLAEQEIESLAKFPEENPNPALRLSRDGILMYANPPSRPLLDLWGCEVGGSVPLFWHDLAVQLLASDEDKTVEVECDRKVYSISIAPIPDAGYVNLYGRDITARKQAEEATKVSSAELSMLFELSRSLADADSLEAVLDAVNRHAVESVHTTFARIALIEEGRFNVRAAYPVREVDHDLGVGDRYPASSLPHTQRLLQHNTPVILQSSDTGIGPEEKVLLLMDFVQSLCLIPLRSTDSSPTPQNLLGVLMLGEVRSAKREPFTPAKIRLAQSIGDSAASAVRRMLLTEQTGRRLKQSIALTEIDLAIISTSDMVYSLQVLLQHATERLNVDAAAAWWLNPATQVLEFVAGRGFRTPAFKDAKPLGLGEGHAGRAAFERRMIHIPDLALRGDNPRLAKALEGEPFVSYYAVPLVVKDQVKGVLELFHRTELESSEEWLKFLNALANQAAIAIDNSSLFNDLQDSNTELTQAYDATIRGWSRALDLRDQETEGHTQRVTELTMNLARRFGLSEEELVHVRRGALLHDIGKMGVPDAILLKAGPLTDEEWVQMRKHPGLAHEMLSPITYLHAALDIPYCHHEKWDGSGYPRRLKGEEIPLAARIFAVIDVYDALTSDRPYRKAWTPEKTLEHIRAGAGTHFDPKVLEVFLESGILQPG